MKNKKDCKPGMGDMAWRSEKKKPKKKKKESPEMKEKENFYKAKGLKFE